MGDLAQALIVARPGRIRDAWRALLLARWEIAAVYEAEDGPGALSVLDRHGADLVLIDAEAPGVEAQALVGRVRTRRPDSRSIVLVRDERQAQQLRDLGADEVLVKGVPAAQLFEAVDRALIRPAGTLDEFEPA